MTTIAQMIEWMKTLPQDAEVECGVEKTKGYETFMEMKPVDIAACDAIDYSSPENREKYPSMDGKIIIMIRGE
jgi:hypothetical protein